MLTFPGPAGRPATASRSSSVVRRRTGLHVPAPLLRAPQRPSASERTGWAAVVRRYGQVEPHVETTQDMTVAKSDWHDALSQDLSHEQMLETDAQAEHAPESPPQELL